jgi:hypothetical protein
MNFHVILLAACIFSQSCYGRESVHRLAQFLQPFFFQLRWYRYIACRFGQVNSKHLRLHDVMQVISPSPGFLMELSWHWTYVMKLYTCCIDSQPFGEMQLQQCCTVRMFSYTFPLMLIFHRKFPTITNCFISFKQDIGRICSLQSRGLWFLCLVSLFQSYASVLMFSWAFES